MLTRLPILIEFTSPRITALNQTEHSSSRDTSPIIVAVDAIKQLFGTLGILPFKGRIVGIFN
tara:strand:+ start:11598 stop:11783 length:186 start_codon:yes stop_codon:yes gene_type:complete